MSLSPGKGGTAGPGGPAHDFSDRLNPVAVREVRRLLRSRWLAMCFCLLHGFVCLATVLEGGYPGFPAGTAAAPSPFPGVPPLAFLAVSAFTVVLPLAHFNALQPELGPGKNGELLVTSGLSASEIAGGRFLAAAGFGALLFVSLLPYFLVLHFRGGIGPFDLVRSLLARFLDHSVLCALVIGVSGFPSVTGRILLVIGLGSVYATLMLPYRLGWGTYLLSSSMIFSWVNEVLGGLLFCLIGIQLALAHLQKLEAPSRVNDPGLVLALAIVAVPFVHGIARGLFGLPGGFLALLFLAGTLCQFAPRPSRKKQLKPEAAAPPLPVT